MAAVHMTRIPYKPYKIYFPQEDHIFTIFFPVLTTLCMHGFKMFQFFPNDCMDVLRGLVCYG